MNTKSNSLIAYVFNALQTERAKKLYTQNLSLVTAVICTFLSANVLAQPTPSKPNMTPTSVPTKPIVASKSAPSVSTTNLDTATYTVQLRDLERRVNDLKEQIRRSHTRLSLLSESILSGVTAASRAELTFHNEISVVYRLKRIVVVYDGSPLVTKTDERDQIGDQKEISLYSELVQPGDHVIQVLAEYHGTGAVFFQYQKGYKFEVRSSRSFTAIEGKTIALRVIGYEQGGPMTPFHERPAIRYAERLIAGVGGLVSKSIEAK